MLGRWPRTFDVKPWIQCTFHKCGKWLETEELRIKHVAKYHEGNTKAEPEVEESIELLTSKERELERQENPKKTATRLEFKPP
ncbi:MAG TPA: hypothetical protein VH415_14135 [Nitrososphaeraceae archaeon]